MPSREVVNQHRAQIGAPELSEEEFMDRTRRVPVDESPPASERTINIRKGLIDPRDPEEEVGPRRTSGRKKKQ